MGQRHQAFLIARVQLANNTHRYRCVATYLHEWCYGLLPLRALHRFLTLLRQPDNVEIVQAELRELDGKYGGMGEEPRIPEVPCPYLAFLVGTAWSVDLEIVEEEGREGGVYVSGKSLRAGLGCVDGLSADGDANDGITIIDITSPADPSYCFVSLGSLDAVIQPTAFTPLSAEEYVRAYHPVPESRRLLAKGEKGREVRRVEREVGRLVGPLEGVRVAEGWVLEEVWPEEYGVVSDTIEEEDEDEDEAEAEAEAERERERERERLEAETAVEGNERPQERQENGEEDADIDALAEALVDLSCAPTIAQALESGNLGEIEKVELSREEARRIKEIIRSQEDVSDLAFLLLRVALFTTMDQEEEEGEGRRKRLDLSGYALTPDQLLDLITALPSAPSHAPIESLNLSFNPFITPDTLRELLPLLPSLRRLVLLGCPRTTVSGINFLIHSSPRLFKSVDALIHPAFLRVGGEASYSYINAFSYVGVYPERGKVTGCSLAYFTPGQIVQNLTDFLTPFTEGERGGSVHMMMGSLAAQAAFSAGERGPDKRWEERNVVSVPAFSRRGFAGEGWVFGWAFGWNGEERRRWGFLKFRVEKVHGSGVNGNVEGKDTPLNGSGTTRTQERSANGDEGKDLQSHGSYHQQTDDFKLAWEIHDLRSFLRVVSEGREQAPESAVKSLEDVFTRLRERRGCRVMEDGDVKRFVDWVGGWLGGED